MKLQVLKQTENPLYDRREVVARAMDTEATPSRKQVLDELCRALHCAADAVVIDKVDQRFGQTSCLVTAKVYASAELAKKYEKAWKQARTAGKPKDAKAEEKK